MLDVQLLRRISTCECTVQEIDDFDTKDKSSYDTEKPFEKYYGLTGILRAIERYRSGEFTERNLAHWAYVYMYILNAGWEKREESTNLRAIVEYEITDTLDSLSFLCEELLEVYDMEKYQQYFRAYDEIFHSLSEWEYNYYPNSGWYVMCVNQKTKRFVVFYHDDVDCLEDIKAEDRHLALSYEQAMEKHDKLLQEGYEKIKHFNYGIDE